MNLEPFKSNELLPISDKEKLERYHRLCQKLIYYRHVLSYNESYFGEAKAINC